MMEFTTTVGVVTVIAALAWLVVTVIAALVWLVAKAADGSVLAGVIAVGIFVVVLGMAINVAIEKSKKGPCHQYETQLMYNPATNSTASNGE